jgi:Putative prokaryotic signal transducing protein
MGESRRVAMSRTDQFGVVEIAGSEPEAEPLCSLLRSAGIDCLPRLTNAGAGAGDGLGIVGSHEILVRSRDAEAAREILHRGHA